MIIYHNTYDKFIVLYTSIGYQLGCDNKFTLYKPGDLVLKYLHGGIKNMVYQYDVQIINRKYKSIVQRFGAQSSYAQEYTGKLLGMGAKPNKQGILQLPTYKKDIARYNERSVFQENIAQMRKFISTQDIKKRVRQTLKAEGIAPEGERGQYTEQQITERVTLEGEIKDIIRDLQAVAYDNNENIKRILFGVDRGGTNQGNLTQADMELIKKFHSELEQNKTIVQYPFE